MIQILLNHLKWVTGLKWIRIFKTFKMCDSFGGCGALSKIKDIIFSKNLKADDVLKRMKFRRGQAALNREQLAIGLNRLSFNLNKSKSLVLADSLLKGRAFLPVSELLILLQCVEDDIG